MNGSEINPLDWSESIASVNLRSGPVFSVHLLYVTSYMASEAYFIMIFFARLISNDYQFVCCGRASTDHHHIICDVK